MEDRIPTPGQEGRVKITPESGNPFYAKLEMADNPMQEGTALNKANLLSDATAAKLNGAETPNAALNLLSAALLKDGTAIKDAPGNLITLPSAQLDERVRIATGSYVGSSTTELSVTITLPFVPKFCVISQAEMSLCLIAGQNYGHFFQNNGTISYVWDVSVAISGTTITLTETTERGWLINQPGQTYDYAFFG